MNRMIYHVVPFKSNELLEWAVKLEGRLGYLQVFRNKIDAIDYARKLAKIYLLGQMKIHDSHGVIQYESTFGKDPERYPG